MEKLFIGYHFSRVLKGKQKPSQVALSAVILLFSLINISGVIRFVSGAQAKPQDFVFLILTIYATANLLFVSFHTTASVTENTAKTLASATAPQEVVEKHDKHFNPIATSIRYINQNPATVKKSPREEATQAQGKEGVKTAESNSVNEKPQGAQNQNPPCPAPNMEYNIDSGLEMQHDFFKSEFQGEQAYTGVVTEDSEPDIDDVVSENDQAGFNTPTLESTGEETTFLPSHSAFFVKNPKKLMT